MKSPKSTKTASKEPVKKTMHGRGLRQADDLKRAALESEERELVTWTAIKDTKDPEELKAFLLEWPDGPHSAEALRLRRAMRRGIFTRKLINGWQLIAIVLAVAWAVGAGLRSWDLSIERAEWQSDPVYEACVSAGRDLKDCARLKSKAFDEEMSDAVLKVILWALVPIPIAWLIISGLIALARWVWARFEHPT
jgi:hypothetical protein